MLLTLPAMTTSSCMASLALLGAFTALYALIHVLSILYLFFIKPSALPASLHPSKQKYLTYALVTGSTDGIGYEVARELSRRGFALVLHGRNPSKLNRVAEDILAENPEAPKPIFLIADADKCHLLDFEALVEPLKKMRVSVLVNNVGGMGHLSGDPFRTVTVYTRSDMDRILDLNLGFMAQLTRVMLPILLRSSDPNIPDSEFDYPVELDAATRQAKGTVRAQIINESSAAELGVPYVVPYGGAKGFVEAFTAGIKAELQAEYIPTSRLDVLCLRIGSVVTTGNPVHEKIWAPSAAVFAKAICDRVGCGRETIEAYFPHWLQVSFFAGLAGETFRRWGIVMNARWEVQERAEVAREMAKAQLKKNGKAQ